MAPTPAPQAPKQKNIVGLIALIVGIVGFVFACIPGALIVGWLLLPVAFILGIVALCLRGKSKWAGLVGLILSVVGSIVGGIVFFAVVATAFDDAFDDASGGDTVITEEVTSEDEGASDEEPAATEDDGEAAEKGTRENPVSFDATTENDDWTVTLADFNPDATANVESDGYTTETAGDDQVWITFTPTVTYHGDDSGLAVEVSFAYAAPDGTVINTFDAMAMLDDGFDSAAELYDGGTTTGRIALLVPNDLDGGLLRVTPGILADDVFVSLP